MSTYLIEFTSGKDIDRTESNSYKFEAQDDESAISHAGSWVIRNSYWLHSNNEDVVLYKEQEGTMPWRVKTFGVPDTLPPTE